MIGVAVQRPRPQGPQNQQVEGSVEDGVTARDVD
jgi:hypothetical protein